MPRPNILFITTDQQRFDHLGLAGLEAVKTPNLDRLGREGVHFERAYCPSPTCTPTRVSLLTGRYPSTHYAYCIGVTADPFPRPTIGELFTRSGYASGIFGKAHFVRRAEEIAHMAGTPNPPEDFFKKWKGPYVGFEEAIMTNGHTINTTPAMHYREFLEENAPGYEKWFPHLTGTYDHDRCGVWEIPPQFHNTTWVADHTAAFIRRQAGGSRPWFAFANFEDPHEPYVCPEPWFSSVDMSRAPDYEGYREGEFDQKPDIYRMAYEKDFGDLNDGSVRGEILGGAVHERCSIPSVYGEPEKEKRKRTALQATLGMVAFLDNRIGHLLQTLEDTRQLENTIIVFTSDHGEMHGHHGLWGKGATAFEDCQRVPLLFWGPGWIRPCGTTPALANLVDIPRTLLNLAGIPLPQEIQGVDLGPVLRRESDSVQDAVLVEMRASQHTFNQHTLITDRHKLVLYKHTDDGELYDLSTDPDQYHNRWNDPDSASLKLQLLHRLARLQMEREPLGPPRVSFA